MKKLFKQIIRFGIVGGVAFLIDYSLLYVLTEYVGLYYLHSSIISFSVSLLFNYIASIKFVFNVSHKQTHKDLMLFVVLSVIGLGINQLVMYFSSDILNIYYMISKLGATAIVMVWNFVTRKYFIDHKKDEVLFNYIDKFFKRS